MTPIDQRWRERRIVAAGVGIAVFEAGNASADAPVLLLVHGLGHWTQAAWNALLPFLDPAVRVVAFDVPGFGASDKPDDRYDTPFFGRVIEAVVADAVPGRFVLAGHSLGGYIAATYAAAHPDRVAGLALIAPAGFLRAARFMYALLGSHLARWIFMRRPGRRFIDRTLDRSVVEPAAISPAIRDAAFALAQDAAVRRAFARVYTGAIQDFRDAAAVHARLRRWSGPTLLVWGRSDRFIPIAALAIARGVYPAARTLVCEQSGHLPMVEEPRIVAAALCELMVETFRVYDP